MASKANPIHQVAQEYGVQITYQDATKQRRQASPEALLRALQAMGAPLQSVDDATDALRHRRQSRWQRLIEPVIVAWNGGPAEVELRFASKGPGGSLSYQLEIENGETQSWSGKPNRLPVSGAASIEGERYRSRRLKLPALPAGYHRLKIEANGESHESLVLSAPVKAYAPSEVSMARTWGVFVPLYALHSKRSWGGGDLRDMEAMLEWVNKIGGGVVATLPLLAALLDEPFEPSPYAPASRLFWNEFYLDVTGVPEFGSNAEAQSLLDSANFKKELRSLRSGKFVDYRRQMALKRRVLEEMARKFFARSSGRRERFREFVASHRYVDDYAGFRAVCERLRSPWKAWPSPLRDGTITPDDYDEQARQYHLFVQWLAQEQIQSLASKASESGPGLYLDFPLGVSSNGYDAWREREAFAQGVSGGAPPDAFFTKGQNWGFPPLHPEKIREQKYRYLISCLRHHLNSAGVLRIDHVMWLHRLFWVPEGMEAKDGVYVRYPSDELYAILNIESHRNKAFIVGEDLGTVPSYVRKDMAKHNFNGMYVVQYEIKPRPKNPVGKVPARSVASINTHDMPMFTAFWEGSDIDDRFDLGLMSEKDVRQEQKQREAMRKALAGFLRRQGFLKGRGKPDAQAVLRACLGYLSASSARVVLVNLEDLWAETKPQNVPGTSEERKNWKRKTRYPLEKLSKMPGVVEALREVDHLWRNKGK